MVLEVEAELVVAALVAGSSRRRLGTIVPRLPCSLVGRAGCVLEAVERRPPGLHMLLPLRPAAAVVLVYRQLRAAMELNMVLASLRYCCSHKRWHCA